MQIYYQFHYQFCLKKLLCHSFFDLNDQLARCLIGKFAVPALCFFQWLAFVSAVACVSSGSEGVEGKSISRNKSSRRTIIASSAVLESSPPDPLLKF